MWLARLAGVARRRGVRAALSRSGRADEQIAVGSGPNTLDACLVKNPLYFPAYEAKAYVLLEARGDRQGALAALQSAMPALADDARLQRAIGELYLRDLKQPALALPYLRRACELDSTDYTARALEKKAQTALEQQVRNPAAHRVP